MTSAEFYNNAGYNNSLFTEVLDLHGQNGCYRLFQIMQGTNAYHFLAQLLQYVVIAPQYPVDVQKL